MGSQYKSVKTDERNNYEYKLRVNRVNNTVVPELKETLRIASIPARIFPVSSIEELETLTNEYKYMINTGNLAIVYDNNSTINQLYVWGKSEENEGWELIINNNPKEMLMDGGFF